MKKWLFLGALLTLSSAAFAHSDHSDGNWNVQPDHDSHHHHHRHWQTVAPEIDPAFAAGAFTLLAGGLVVVLGRRTSR